MKARPATILQIDGRSVHVRLRRNTRAHQLILRLNKDGTGVVVTLPKGVSKASGVAWAKQQTSWIATQMATLPERTVFVDGAIIPFEGSSLMIRHLPSARRGVWQENNEIKVSGQPEHLARRVRDWLRSEARFRLVEKTIRAASRIDMEPGKITVRDTRTRWGSCSANGNISYCWRLILAPTFVLDYVVSHEVAHLKEPDHGPNFWKTVAMLEPNVNRARRWLREQGRTLHFIG